MSYPIATSALDIMPAAVSTAMKYEYSIATNVKNATLNAANLESDIKTSNITVALIGVVSTGDQLFVVFKNTISSAEITILTTLLSNHDSTDRTSPVPQFQILQTNISTGGKPMTMATYIQGDPLTPTDVSNGVTKKYTEQSFQWDHNISVLSMKLRPTDSNAGDFAQLYVTFADQGYGEGVMDQPAADVAATTTTIKLSSFMMSNVLVGDFLYIYSPAVNSGAVEELGYIVALHPDTSTVTMSAAPIQSYTASLSFLKFRRYLVHDFAIGPPELYTLSSTKLIGSSLYMGMIAKTVYINTGTTTKTLYIMLDYFE